MDAELVVSLVNLVVAIAGNVVIWRAVYREWRDRGW
jgi:hypothetical protein